MPGRLAVIVAAAAAVVVIIVVVVFSLWCALARQFSIQRDISPNSTRIRDLRRPTSAIPRILRSREIGRLLSGVADDSGSSILRKIATRDPRGSRVIHLPPSLPLPLEANQALALIRCN